MDFLMTSTASSKKTMSDHKIDASKVTKPIQLLAAWLAGLIIINGSFLTAAARLEHPDWASGLLVISAVLNVPIFLFGLFLLQTKFRPEMQEDEFYSKYLEKRYSVDSKTDELIEVVARTSRETCSVDSSQTILSHEKPIPEDSALVKNKLTAVCINDLLPSFEVLSRELLDNNIEIDSTFGSTSKKPEVPNVFHISFGDDINIRTLKTIVSICQRHGLDSISYASTNTAHGKIYIGSLGYQNKKRKLVPAAPEFLNEILAENMSLSRLKSILFTRGSSNSSINRTS